MLTAALFSVDVHQTSLFQLLDINQTAVFYWLTLTTALFQLVDAVDVQFYSAFHLAQEVLNITKIMLGTSSWSPRKGSNNGRD